MTSGSRSDMAALHAAQRTLEARVEEAGDDPREVLAVGEAVLAFAEREEPALFPLLPLLDPAARAELAGEHAGLDDDLDLLASLVEADPASADARELAAALCRRLRQHVRRDGRLLAQAARLADP